MKKNTLMKMLCLLLCIMLLVSGCGDSGSRRKDKNHSDNHGSTEDSENPGSDNKDPQKDSYVPNLTLGDSNFSEEEAEYIRLHLEFIEGGTYKDICAVPGGLASKMSADYRAAALDKVNGFWKDFSTIALVLGSGELELSNEYQLLVGAMMQSTAAREAYNESFEQGYMTAVCDMIGGISKTLSDHAAVIEFLDPSKDEDAQKLASDLDEILTDLEKALGEKPENVENLYKDAWEDAKKKMGLVFDEKDTKLIGGVLKGFQFAGDLTGKMSDTYSEVMDEYVLLSACSRASEEYIETWNAIKKELQSSSDSEAKRVGAALADYMEKIEGAQSDMQAQLLKKAQSSAAGNMFEFGLGIINEEFDEILDSHPVLKGIRWGLTGGVKLSNWVTNMDDIAFYGKMYMGGGLIADAAYKVMAADAKKLQSEKTFTNAVRFDEAFNIYKHAQMSTYDSGIEYCTAIASAPLGHILKYTVDDEIVAADMLLIEKVKWSGYFCHRDTKVKNNGGHVVGLGDALYYWENTSASYEKGGLFGNFSENNKTYNNLIMQIGEEKSEVIKAIANGRIFICNRCIYYSSSMTNWRCLDLDKNTTATLKNENIVGAIADEGILIYQDKTNYKLHMEDAEGKVHDLPDSCNSYLGTYGGKAFFANLDSSKGNAVFAAVDLRNGYAVTELGSVHLNLPSMCGISCGAPVFEEDGMYISVGIIGGTGYFFTDGVVYRIGYEGGMEELISKDKNGHLLGMGNIYIKHEEENRTLYFYGGDTLSTVGLWNGEWATTNLFAYDIQSGEISGASGIVSKVYDPVFVDGKIQMMLDDSGKYTTILTADEAKSLGYAGLGNVGNTTVYAPWVEIVDNYAYVCLQSLKPDESYSIGWRQGYKLLGMGVYRVNLGDPNAKITVLYEFTN